MIPQLFRTSRDHHCALAWRGVVALCMILLATSSVHAAETEPERIVKVMVASTVDALKNRRSDQRGAPGAETGLEITTRLIAPHVDFDRLAREALGPRWDTATPAQQTAISRELRTLLLHVTGKVLMGYNDEVLAVEPVTLVEGATEIDIRINVKATRYSGDEPPDPMFVSLHKTGAGWKIFDLRAEGRAWQSSMQATSPPFRARLKPPPESPRARR